MYATVDKFIFSPTLEKTISEKTSFLSYVGMFLGVVQIAI